MVSAVQTEASIHECPILSLGPEFELVLAGCQATPCANCLARIPKSDVNWDLILRLAERHRVLPALYSSLRDRADVPVSIHSAIRQRFQNNEVKGLRFSAELARIVTHFADCGIDVLAHKGPALALALYGDPAMRHFGDLDLLVRSDDVVGAKLALQQLGFQSQLCLSTRQEKAYLQSGYEYVFGTHAERSLVEVQWQILPRFYSISFDMQALFDRSVEIELQGFRMRTPGKEDLMLVLCVHAAKHEWLQLGMLRDIAALARFDLDWRWIKAEAQRLGIIRILDVSLLLACNLLGLKLPELPASQDRSAVELAAEIQSKLVSGADADAVSVRYFRFMARARERWQDRVCMAWRLAITPSVGEWQAIPIPDSLFPAYRAVRAMRLLGRFCP
jgi:Uncharacterised nucleotidyltransferase